LACIASEVHCGRSSCSTRGHVTHRNNGIAGVMRLDGNVLYLIVGTKAHAMASAFAARI